MFVHSLFWKESYLCPWIKRCTMKRKSKRSKGNTKVWLTVLVALAVCYVFGVYKQEGRVELLTPQPARILDEIKRVAVPQAASSRSGAEAGMALPAPLEGRDEHILHHKGYVVSYNSVWKIPNWVAWELTARETKPKMNREDSFCEDPDFDGPQATLADYRRSGYSRGHMAPAADMRWDREAMEECFYLTNMCPQKSDFNAGNWGKLERQCREWAQRDSAIWIVCGPIVGKSPKRIGEGRVVVPDAFYKVVLVPYAKTPRAIGFIFPHRNKKGARTSEFMMSVDEVERRTGIDFFASLPDELERKVEAQNPAGRWRF